MDHTREYAASLEQQDRHQNVIKLLKKKIIIIGIRSIMLKLLMPLQVNDILKTPKL